MTEPFTIDEKTLSFMRCPVTHGKLSQAPADLVEQANQLIASSALNDRLGQSVPGPIETAFVNDDRSLLIPVRGGIVVMLEDRLIPMNQFSSAD